MVDADDRGVDDTFCSFPPVYAVYGENGIEIESFPRDSAVNGDSSDVEMFCSFP